MHQSPDNSIIQTPTLSLSRPTRNLSENTKQCDYTARIASRHGAQCAPRFAASLSLHRLLNRAPRRAHGNVRGVLAYSWRTRAALPSPARFSFTPLYNPLLLVRVSPRCAAGPVALRSRYFIARELRGYRLYRFASFTN